MILFLLSICSGEEHMMKIVRMVLWTRYKAKELLIVNKNLTHIYIPSPDKTFS